MKKQIFFIKRVYFYDIIANYDANNFVINPSNKPSNWPQNNYKKALIYRRFMISIVGLWFLALICGVVILLVGQYKRQLYIRSHLLLQSQNENLFLIGGIVIGISLALIILSMLIGLLMHYHLTKNKDKFIKIGLDSSYLSGDLFSYPVPLQVAFSYLFHQKINGQIIVKGRRGFTGQLNAYLALCIFLDKLNGVEFKLANPI